MRTRIASRLRKLATRLDGERYVPTTGKYKGAIAFVDTIEDEIQDHVTKAMVDGEGSGQPMGIAVCSPDTCWPEESPYLIAKGTGGELWSEDREPQPLPKRKAESCNCFTPIRGQHVVAHLPLCPLATPTPVRPSNYEPPLENE